jgi:hypothetical protein
MEISLDEINGWLEASENPIIYGLPLFHWHLAS